MPAPRSPAVAPAQFATFGELLKFLRRRAGLTQRELSFAVGYSTSQISRLEQDERPPDAASLAARFIPALQLGTEPDWAARLLELAAASRVTGQSARTYRAASALPPNNLPSQLTSFIGRESEIAQGRQLLKTSRLLMLTGPGGAGKTRLSLETAASVLRDFPDGVWLVELAPVADPALVPQAVASVLGVTEQPGQPVLDVLKSYLRARKALLVLDNCEHLIEACAQLAQALLRACPDLQLLATSREALRVTGEAIYVVPPLSMPDPQHSPVLERMLECEAVRLFAERAQSALPGFQLTRENARAVAEVCRSLDGMPLSIELAAARVRLLSVDQIAARLADRFQLLKGGARAALPRHQTLEALMDWSYDLLPEPERSLLRRLAVFAGGWTLEAAEQVCGDESGRIGAVPVLDLLDGLVGKSLVVVERQAGQEARYHFLETIRQYSLAKLAVSGEADAARRRHAQFYRALAETVEPLLITAAERRWLDRLAADLDNLRAAVMWSQSLAGDREVGLQLASALREFWMIRGPLSEGLAWLEGVLSTEGAIAEPVRAQALNSAGWLAQAWGDYPAAERFLNAALRIGRTTSDARNQAWALCGLGAVAWYRRELDAAHTQFVESLAIFRTLEDGFGMVMQLYLLGAVARARGDSETARAQYFESLGLAKQMGYLAGIAGVAMDLGHLARGDGDDPQAAAFYDEALAVYRELSHKAGATEILIGKAQLARNRGDFDEARVLLTEAVVTIRDVSDRNLFPYCLVQCGGLATAQGQPERGMRLLSAASAAFARMGARMGVRSQAEYDRDLAAAREKLDEVTFGAEWATGQILTREQAIDLALSL